MQSSQKLNVVRSKQPKREERKESGKFGAQKRSSLGARDAKRAKLLDQRKSRWVRDASKDPCLDFWDIQRGCDCNHECLCEPGCCVGMWKRRPFWLGPLHRSRDGQLLLAAKEGRAIQARLLMDAGADPGKKSKLRGLTPLMEAAKWGQVDAVKALADAAGIDQADDRGETALHVAAFFGQEECVGALLAAGADPKRKCNEGENALMSAFFWPYSKNKLGIAKKLVPRVDLDDRDNKGRTALMHAALRCVPQDIKPLEFMLSQSGDDWMEKVNLDGKTLLEVLGEMRSYGRFVAGILKKDWARREQSSLDKACALGTGSSKRGRSRL